MKAAFHLASFSPFRPSTSFLKSTCPIHHSLKPQPPPVYRTTVSTHRHFITMTQPKLKFTYFGFPGGRGEPVRLAMLMGNVDFEDDRVTPAEFGAMKPDLPLGSLPVLTVGDDVKIVQSNAILRYVGALGGLYPVEDRMQAMYVDMIIDTVGDLSTAVFSYSGNDKDELRKARERALSDGGRRYWGGCERLIATIPGSDNGPYVLGDKVSIADALIAGLYNLFAIEFLEFIPASALSEYKRMKAVHEAVMSRPEVIKHYEKYPLKKL